MNKIRKFYGRCDWSFEDGYVHVFNLFVFKKFRRCGKAKQLLNFAIKEIRNTGYDGPISIVPDSKCLFKNKLAKLYEKMGFEVFDYYG